jgi:nucleoside-diphosphate-sugar epimerase
MAAVMYGHAPDRTKPFNAADWTNPDGPGVNAYVESKLRAERTAWEIAEKHRRVADLVAVNPGMIFGPLLDDDAGTSGQLIVRLLGGRLPAVAKITMIAIDVRDVAALHLRAMTEGSAGGHRFPAGVDTVSLLEIAGVLRERFPDYAAKLPRATVPDWVVRLFAFLDADARGNVGELGHVWRADTSSAAALLRRPFVPTADAIAATADSAIAQGLVRP